MWICTICSLIKILKVCFVVLNWRVVFTSIDVFACLTYIFLSNYFFVSLPFPKFHAHTHSNNFLIQRFQISFDIYRPSIYMIRLTAGMDGIPGLFINQILFDNIIFLFHESKYNWKLLSTFLKNHFAILLNICHLMY